MSDGWYPDAIIDQGNSAGDYTDNGEPKGCLHTTEGKSYEGARSSYHNNNSWPHATATYEDDVFKIFQHNSIFVASRALKNLSGGTETNRDRIAQLEMVGSADVNNKSWGDQYVENFPQPYLDGIAKWMRWVETTLGVPRRSTVTWKSYPSSYGSGNGIRLSSSQFDAYSGWLGHQHVPENTHGDPGLIDIPYLLTPATVQQEDDMAFIMRADGQARLVLGDSKAVQILESKTINAFMAAGQVRDIGAGDFQRIMNGLAAAENVDVIE